MNTDKENVKKEYDTYLVRDEELLYKLASYSLLDKLCRGTPNRYVECARVWFFEKDPSVENAMKNYREENAGKHEVICLDERREAKMYSK